MNSNPYGITNHRFTHFRNCKCFQFLFFFLFWEVNSNPSFPYGTTTRRFRHFRNCKCFRFLFFFFPIVLQTRTILSLPHQVANWHGGRIGSWVDRSDYTSMFAGVDDRVVMLIFLEGLCFAYQIQWRRPTQSTSFTITIVDTTIAATSNCRLCTPNTRHHHDQRRSPPS